MAALQYLESLRNAHPELSDWYNSLADLYQKKLWHQLTLKLEQFVALAVFQVCFPPQFLVSLMLMLQCVDVWLWVREFRDCEILSLRLEVFFGFCCWVRVFLGTVMGNGRLDDKNRFFYFYFYNFFSGIRVFCGYHIVFLFLHLGWRCCLVLEKMQKLRGRNIWILMLWLH